MNDEYQNVICPFCGSKLMHGLPEGLNLRNIRKTYKKITQPILVKDKEKTKRVIGNFKQGL